MSNKEWTWNSARLAHNTEMAAAGWLSFKGADLRGEELVFLRLAGCSFEGADLRGATIEGTLRGVSFKNANLERAIINAFMDCVSFEGAKIDRASIYFNLHYRGAGNPGGEE